MGYLKEKVGLGLKVSGDEGGSCCSRARRRKVREKEREKDCASCGNCVCWSWSSKGELFNITGGLCRMVWKLRKGIFGIEGHGAVLARECGRCMKAKRLQSSKWRYGHDYGNWD